MLHFEQRCLDRGITSVDPRSLRLTLERAVREGMDDLVEKVMTINNDRTIWRFRVPEEGIFYALMTATGDAVTLLTQEMVRDYKARRRRVKGR